MAQILLHGTLHASIFEAQSLQNPHRASGGAPKFIRKVLSLAVSSSVLVHAQLGLTVTQDDSCGKRIIDGCFVFTVDHSMISCQVTCTDFFL
jgi:hypothetical protein